MFGLMWILELELARESGDPLLTYPEEFRDRSAARGVLALSSRESVSLRLNTLIASVSTVPPTVVKRISLPLNSKAPFAPIFT